jgi:poly-gamma-glutamate capsule biosynthesis protein CapA/YwtB (metallophosphatase superfamily)
MDSYDSDSDSEYSSPEAPSYLEAAARGLVDSASAPAGETVEAPLDSQDPGETVAEASQGAPTKTQSYRWRRARAATRRQQEMTGPARRVPATQRVGD